MLPPFAIGIVIIFFLILNILEFIVKNLLIVAPILVVLTAILTFFYLKKKENKKKQAEEIEKWRIKERENREKYEREFYEKIRIEKEEIEKREKEKFNAIQVADIDSMTGVDFEKYLKKLLIAMDYDVILTKTSGDFGVDLIASKENDKIAIQAKRYKTKVSRRAISDAVAGMQHYNCNKAMVITSSYFTRDAFRFANSTNCRLIDRDTLASWIVVVQKEASTTQSKN